MIDLHSHILPNIDDGSQSLEESIQIIKQAVSNGVTDIVVTPHFILGSIYNSQKENNKKILKTLTAKLIEENININLYLGNEIFIDIYMLQNLLKKKTSSLNDSRYVLFELPMNSEYKNIRKTLFDLQNAGYIPVIAHPERYRVIKENPQIVMEWQEAGAIFQSNIGSLSGRYGKEAKKTLELLLKHQFITFLSSDIHHSTDTFYQDIDKSKKILKKIITDDYIEDLFTNNAKKVLKNEKIETRTVIPITKNIFGIYK